MKRLLVIAVRWNKEKNQVENFVAGEFTEWTMARIFRDAYNAEFHANAEIIEITDLVNNYFK